MSFIYPFFGYQQPQGILNNAQSRYDMAAQNRALASRRAPAPQGRMPGGMQGGGGFMGAQYAQPQQQEQGGGIGESVSDALDLAKQGKNLWDKFNTPSNADPIINGTKIPGGQVDFSTGSLTGGNVVTTGGSTIGGNGGTVVNASDFAPGSSGQFPNGFPGSSSWGPQAFNSAGGLAAASAIPGMFSSSAIPMSSTLAMSPVAPLNLFGIGGSGAAGGAAAGGAAAGGGAAATGTTGAAGGLGAGMAAAAPYAIGALAAYVAFNEIFGGKASDKTGTGTVNLATGELGTFGGMEGKRSPKNEAAARQIAQFLGQSAAAQGGLQGDVRVRVGDRDGISLQMGNGPRRWLSQQGAAGEYGMQRTLERLALEPELFQKFFYGGKFPEYDSPSYWMPRQVEHREMTGRGYRLNQPSADHGGPATWGATANTKIGAAHPTQSGKVFERWNPGYESSGSSEPARAVWGYSNDEAGRRARQMDKQNQLWESQGGNA